MDSRTDAPNSTRLANAIGALLRDGEIGALATVVRAPEHVGQKLLVDNAGRRFGTLGVEALDRAAADFSQSFLASRTEAKTFKIEQFAPELSGWSGAAVLFERIEPEPRLVICGAGHVGAALANLARFTGYRTTLIDDRPDFLTRERFRDESLELVVAGNWGGAVATAIGNGRGVSVAIVTRGHSEDEECLRAVVSSRPDYIGLIGSKRRTNIVLKRVGDTGGDPEVLRRVRAPVGLDIGAVTPEEVALSILAEVVAERRGRHGGSMSEWRRKAP
jgi:xanthine dehydrogenase accessory factor